MDACEYRVWRALAAGALTWFCSCRVFVCVACFSFTQTTQHPGQPSTVLLFCV